MCRDQGIRIISCPQKNSKTFNKTLIFLTILKNTSPKRIRKKAQLQIFDRLINASLILHQICFSQSQHCHCLVKDFFSKCEQISSFLRIYSHLQKKSINFYFLQRHYEQEDFIVLGINRKAFLERQIHYICKIVVFKRASTTILAKISQTNCSFSVKQHTTGKVKFLFFKNLLLVLTKV